MGLTSPAAVKARMKQQPVDYVIFDLLHLDGRCVRELPYLRRRELLEGLGLDGPRWRTPAYRLDGGPDLLEAARRQGLEGIVAKRTDSPYRPGKRTGEWIKTRVWRRQEFVIGGYIPGEGRRAKRVGSLLVGYYDKRRSELRRGQRQTLHFAGGVGSGLKESDLDFLTKELRKRERPDTPFDVGAPTGPEGPPRGLVRARARLRGLLDRVDQRGNPPPARLQGHALARRQGSARGRQRIPPDRLVSPVPPVYMGTGRKTTPGCREHPRGSLRNVEGFGSR